LAIVVPVAIVAGAWIAWSIFADDEEPERLTLYGNVDIRELDLGFRVPGRLVAMDVDEGDAVEAGQVLAELDAQPFRDALAAADARVEQAEAQLAKLRHGARPQEIVQAEASLREAQAALTNAQAEHARQRRLIEFGATSQENLDAARERRDRARAAQSHAQAALALAREGFRDEDIAAGEAQLAAAEAQRAQVQTDLADTVLKAPSNATVLSRVREPGSMLAQGMPVYALSLRDPVYVRAYVGEPDLGRLAPGTTAWVTTDSSETRYRGTIGFISPRAEFTPKSVETTDLRTDLVYRLRIVVDEADQGLRQGMPVTVTVPTGADGKAAVPLARSAE
jgi:HlyD family secretion protein